MSDPILIDCDPGIDHVATIYYAAQHFNLVQVTTTHGNAPLAATTRNALQLLEYGGLDVPVAAGCDRALIEARHSAELFHGDNGLAGVVLPAPKSSVESRHAVEAIIDTAQKHSGELTIACLGPVTNLAIAFRVEPRLRNWVKKVTLMGGSHGLGHMTPTTEFNFWCDPEAASIVCASDMPTQIIGYELTRTLGFDEGDISVLLKSDNKVAQLVGQVFQFNLEKQKSIWGLPHTPIHSTLTIVPLVRPDLVRTRRRVMSVELSGHYTRGMSVYDDRPIELLPAPPFEKLPPSTVECTTWIDPAAIAHVVSSLVRY